MFSFAPASVYDSTPLRQPRRYRPEARLSASHATNPRDRYLAALAEAEAAEADYVAAIAREKAIQRQRDEEVAAAARREAAALQRQRTDALRRQAVFDAVYAQEESYPSYDYNSAPIPTPSRYGRTSPFDAQAEEEALVIRELERRRALALRRKQEEEEAARVVAALELKKRERDQAIAAAREAKIWEQEAKLSQRSDEELLNLLFNGRSAVRRVPSQEKVAMAERPRGPASCIAQRTPRQKPTEASWRQPDVLELLATLFNGQVEKKEDVKLQRPNHSRHVSFAGQPQGPTSPTADSPGATVKPASAPAPTPRSISLEDLFSGHINSETGNEIQRTLQSLFGPTGDASATTRAPVAETSTPTPAQPALAGGVSLQDLLQSRLNNETETDVRDTLHGLLGSIFGNAQQAPAESKTKAPAAAPASTSASGLSLKEQLEARLHRDPNVEVHDTIQAILASLKTPYPPRAPSPSSTSTKATPPAPASSSSLSAEGKGKGKVESAAPAPSLINPTSKDVLDAMDAIHSIEAHFAVLASEFSFPTRLEFTPPSSRPSSPSSDSDSSSLTSHLAYTSANAPVRYYEQALTALLAQLDAVESFGNEDVRKTRKQVVARIESALEDVEREVRERFVQRQARNAAAQASEKKVEVKEESVEQPVEAGEKVDAPALAEEKVEETDNVTKTEEPVAVEEAVAEAEDSVVVDEAVAEESINVTEPVQQAEVTNSVADLDVKEPNEESAVQDVAETKAPEAAEDSAAVGEPFCAPIAAPVSPIVKDIPLRVDSFSLPSSIDSYLSDHELDTAPVEDVTPVTVQPMLSAEPQSLASSMSTVIFATAEATEVTPTSSYPPTPAPATTLTATEPEPEMVDTFLLPDQFPIIPKRPTSSNDDDEVVVVDTHSEASDWSELDA